MPQQKMVEISKREDSIVLSQDEPQLAEEQFQGKKFMASLKKKKAHQPIGSTLQSKMEALKAGGSLTRAKKHTASALTLNTGTSAKASIFGNPVVVGKGSSNRQF